MEEIKKEKLIKEITPEFNFIYELFMPTGKKIKSSLSMLVVAIVLIIVVYLNSDILAEFSYNITDNISLSAAFKIICYFMIIFSTLKLIIHVILQKKQYENISYKFYETYMIYEDKFLNQHKKNILYSNVKEVEIRRTIWDRLTGHGVIIIYTNAENKRNNGLVIYAIKNPDKYYELIDKVVNRYKVNFNNKNVDNEVSYNNKYEKQNEKCVDTNINTYDEKNRNK